MKRLTDTACSRLTPRSSRFLVHDPDHDGFVLAVYPTGRKTFMHIFTWEGRRVWQTLGRYPSLSLRDARAKWAKNLELLEKDVNPVAALAAERSARLAAPTVNELFELWLERWGKPNKRSWRQDVELYARNIEPHVGSIKAKELTRAQVRDLLDTIMRRVKARKGGRGIQVNRTLALLRSVYNWGFDNDLVEVNPCHRIKPPAPERAKERFLADGEVRTLWQTMDDPEAPVSADTRRALKLILLTAARPGEVCGMTWLEIETDADGTTWWKIPGTRTKNGTTHRIPLSSLAVEVLGESGEGYVFKTPKGNNTREGTTNPTHIDPHALAKVLRRVRKWTPDFPEFTPHDLRRTTATHISQDGTTREVVMAILNHSDKSVTAIYDRAARDPEKRLALEGWARKIQFIMTGTSAAVIPFPRKGGKG